MLYLISSPTSVWVGSVHILEIIKRKSQESRDELHQRTIILGAIEVYLGNTKVKPALHQTQS
jgi:hypothetical protein